MMTNWAETCSVIYNKEKNKKRAKINASWTQTAKLENGARTVLPSSGGRRTRKLYTLQAADASWQVCRPRLPRGRRQWN